MSSAQPQHTPSLSEAFERSLQWARNLLFPFDLGRWISFAFIAWLMVLGQGGGAGFQGFNGNFNLGGPRGGVGPSFEEQTRKAAEWVDQHMVTILAVGVPVIVVIAALAVLLIWLSAHGQLMFTHAVVTGEPAIEDSWRRTSPPANSLFRVRLLIWAVTFVLGLLSLGLAAAGTLSVMRQGLPAWEFFLALFWNFLPIIVVWIPINLALWVFHVFLYDFVVLIMYRRDMRFLPAWGLFWGLLMSRIGTFFLYFLVRFLLVLIVGLLMGIVSLLATCLTCCILALPVLNMIPILYFLVLLRAFPIFYLEQFGPDWEIFPRATPPAPQVGPDAIAPLPPQMA